MEHKTFRKIVFVRFGSFSNSKVRACSPHRLFAVRTMTKNFSFLIYLCFPFLSEGVGS